MIVTGSTIVPEAFVRKVGARGVPGRQVYGSTETCPIAGLCARAGLVAQGRLGGLAGAALRAASIDEQGATCLAGRTANSWCAGRM
jgi:fatty-acyl-CoA synthase